MLAVAILAENENAMGTRIGLTLLSTETAPGIAAKTIIDALLEACKTLRPSQVLPSPYQRKPGSTWEHVVLRQFCSRTQPSGIVAKANNHRLRVAGKHYRLAGVHAMLSSSRRAAFPSRAVRGTQSCGCGGRCQGSSPRILNSPLCTNISKGFQL